MFYAKLKFNLETTSQILEGEERIRVTVTPISNPESSTLDSEITRNHFEEIGRLSEKRTEASETEVEDRNKASTVDSNIRKTESGSELTKNDKETHIRKEHGDTSPTIPENNGPTTPQLEPSEMSPIGDETGGTTESTLIETTTDDGDEEVFNSKDCWILGTDESGGGLIQVTSATKKGNGTGGTGTGGAGSGGAVPPPPPVVSVKPAQPMPSSGGAGFDWFRQQA